MSTHVNAQFVFALERLATKCTNIRFPLRVAMLVSRQGCSRAEKLAALLALIGLLWRMSLLMEFQRTDAGKHFPAPFARDSADVLVTKLVLHQLTPPFEALPALGAVTLVNTRVFTFVPHRLKAFPTLDANIVCFLALCPPVGRQIRARPKTFPTLRALVGVLSSVQPLMLQEFKTVNEAFGTVRASVCNSRAWGGDHRAGHYRTRTRC